jgi:eukaryotic-like serine/threonine-protein kinase
MNRERFQQVETIFQAALKRDPASRASFLDGACLEDDDLRAEVESLLAAHDDAGSFIHTPALDVAAELMADEHSDALINHSIGQYKIIAKIGAGGMGEVYLAQDSKLARKVALKLLPDFFVNDRERLTRFHQEARAASSLNHPNIITIHEIGQVGSAHFIATEFIEGQTLRQVIASGSLKMSEALDVVIQSASALAAAHTAGIVHRDIKPENIMLRPDGYVKVLDFGLAKQSREQAFNTTTDSPTLARVSTNPGVVMGTASYMSPEQARGQRVDARTDVWSLGVVLYEMIAGRLPFEGDNTGDVIAAILDKQAPPLARYAPNTPAELQRIVSKALRKNVDQRYQVIKEMLNDLRELKQELEVQARLAGNLSSVAGRQTNGADAASASAVKLAAATAQEVTVKTGEATARNTSSAEVILSEIKKHKTGTVVVFVLLVIVFAALGIGLYRFVQSKSSQTSQTNQPGAASQTIRITPFPVNGTVGAAGISPDGKYFVYSLVEMGGAGDSLWVKHLPTGSTVQIFPPAKLGYEGFGFTSDSNYFYYTTRINGQYSLNKLPVIGGTAKKLIADFGDASCTISPDGRQVAFIRLDNKEGAFHLVVVNEDGTGERVLLSHRGDEWFQGGIDWSPDGKTIAYILMSEADGGKATVMAVRVEDGSEKAISVGRWRQTSSLLWLPDGSGLVFSGRANRTAPGQIWRVTYPSGEVRKLTNDLNDYSPRNFTADGNTLLAFQSKNDSDIWTMPFAQAGDKPAQITFSKTDEFGAWTPEGKIVFVSTMNDNRSLWIMNADGSDRRQLTSGSDDRYPSVSPDGRHIVFRSLRSGMLNLWRVDIDGSRLQQLSSQSSENNLPCYTPDGKWIVFVSIRSGKGTVCKMPAEGGEAIPLTNKATSWPAPSPDGKLVACADMEAPQGKNRVLILPIEGGELTQVIELPANSTLDIGWTPDGRAITYRSWQDNLSGIWKQPLAGGPPVLLTSWTPQVDRWRQYVLSPDGKQWGITRTGSLRDLVLISDFK